MKIAALTKAALCVCPPAIIATTAVTVPPVRRAVHHLTAPHRSPVGHRPRHHVLARTPCGAGGSVGGGNAGPAPLRTFADAGPSDLVTGPASTFTSPYVPSGLTPDSAGETPGDYRSPTTVAVATPGGIVPAVGSGGGGNPGPVPVAGTGDQPTSPAVPEPTTWALLLAGVGGIGLVLRARRGRGPSGASAGAARPGVARLGTMRSGAARSGLAIAGLSMDVVGALPAGHLAAAASTAGTGAKSTKAALLAKAALCVCPPALLATSVATVPPVRHAVYAATAPRERARPVAAALPCGPEVAGATIAPQLRSADVGAPAAADGTVPSARGDAVRRTARRS